MTKSAGYGTLDNNNLSCYSCFVLLMLMRNTAKYAALDFSIKFWCSSDCYCSNTAVIVYAAATVNTAVTVYTAPLLSVMLLQFVQCFL